MDMTVASTTMKTVMDLLLNLNDRVSDRKTSEEISRIFKLVMSLQAEIADFAAENIALGSEKLDLKNELFEEKQKNLIFKTQATITMAKQAEETRDLKKEKKVKPAIIRS